MDVSAEHRLAVLDELLRGHGGGWRQALRTRWKRHAWLAVTRSAASVKRTIDIAGAILGLLALAPLFMATAVLIAIADGGPALFWQTRVGRWGREFPFPKFRSMVVDADRHFGAVAAGNQHTDARTFKMRLDPRITWIGRWLRKFSIDELPQLWCVLIGQMSLVGPRPPVPQEVALYSLADRRRLDVKPGLTCIWQVSGRAELDFRQQVELDAQYIHSHSLLFDLKLLLRTIPAVLLGKGAY